MTFYLYVD